MTELRKIAIVGSARIPFCRAYTGYSGESNLTMLGTALSGLADKFNLKGEKIDEVMGGAVISHSRDFNLTREALLDAGLSPRTPGTNIQIACGTNVLVLDEPTNHLDLPAIEQLEQALET